MRLKTFLCCLCLWLVTFSAQIVCADPNGQVILDRQREQQNRPEPLSQPKMQIVDDQTGQTGIDETMPMNLHSLTISGATVFKEDELLAPYRKLYGQSVTFEQLRSISAELTKKYREAGYLLSRVIVPNQEADPEAADIRLVVVEGFIESIKYSGDQRILNRFKSYFSPVENRLKGKKPLKHSDFERYMLLMKDLPGVDVSSRFERGQNPGASVLHIDVKGELMEGGVNWGNTGTEEIGPEIGSISFGINTLPLIGNKTTVTYTQSTDIREYWSVQVAERYQFWNGLTFVGSYSYSDSQKMDSDWAHDMDYTTNSNTFNIGFFYPIIRSRDLNLSVGINYEHRNSDAFISDDHFTKDRLRTLSAYLNFDFADRFGGITQIIPRISRGLDIFEASDESDKSTPPTNPYAPAEYWKFSIYASRDQQLPYNFSFFTATEAYFSNESLSSYNRFSFGGSQFGRGYEPGIIEGDNGFAVSFEPRWTYYPTDNTSLQLFSFIDYGTVWTSDSQRGKPDIQEASSVGAGLRLWGHLGNDFFPDFNISAFVAQPLRGAGDNDADMPRFVLQGGIYF